MATFKTRLSQVSKTNGKVILANDYDSSEKNLQNKTIQNIKKLNPYLCGIKLNFHLLLPLSAREIIKIKGMPIWREELITDNGNIILDINHLDIIEPIKLEKELEIMAEYDDKLSILKMKRYYHENTGGRSELLDLSKKQFKEVKKDEAELGKLLLELKQYEKNGQFQELIEEANKHLVKLNNNDINIVNYCKFLVSLEKTDQAIEILEKRRRELEKKEVKSVSLDRFLKYLQSK